MNGRMCRIGAGESSERRRSDGSEEGGFFEPGSHQMRPGMNM
jgi:hypothetical protein